MSFGGQAWDQFLGGPSAAEFENLGALHVMELFLDVPIDEVLGRSPYSALEVL